ncbi:hypothetical protein [Pseudomonas putida]|uniref:Uncharacterized protein n=1 Tax=Pseudomonas putida TaxID=303 RepID=A0A177SAS3_PSEPU|nr:hypothetical protein [Pseudomonas putida]OAI84922.1 hypothetical protein AYO28_03310 [Pseudomonas putida]
MKIGKLFIGLEWCYGAKDQAVILSWALKSGYWRWSIWWRKPQSIFCMPALGPSMAVGTRYYAGGGHFGAWLRLPLVGSLSIQTQPPYPQRVAQ